MCQGIYKKGGRKFGFANGIPLGCVPMMRATKPGNTGTCVDEISAILKLHNSVLAKVLLKLKGQLQGFKYSDPNVYSCLDGIIKNPSKYGTNSLHTFFFLTFSFASFIRYD